jgi:hypothetical protein
LNISSRRISFFESKSEPAGFASPTTNGDGSLPGPRRLVVARYPALPPSSHRKPSWLGIAG